jgi:hypothetical protein
MESRKRKPVCEGILFQVREGENGEGREKRGNGINGAVIYSIPDLGDRLVLEAGE